jgi:hypothetical protein
LIPSISPLFPRSTGLWVNRAILSMPTKPSKVLAGFLSSPNPSHQILLLIHRPLFLSSWRPYLYGKKSCLPTWQWQLIATSFSIPSTPKHLTIEEISNGSDDAGSVTFQWIIALPCGTSIWSIQFILSCWGVWFLIRLSSSGPLMQILFCSPILGYPNDDWQ